MQTWIKYIRTGAEQVIDVRPPHGFKLHSTVPCGDIGLYFVFTRGKS